MQEIKCKYCCHNKNGACELNNKPYFCTIATRRGVVINIKDSNIVYHGLKFNSVTQKNKFLKLLKSRFNELNKIKDKLFVFTGNTKLFDISNLYVITYNKTYKDCVGNGIKNSKKAEG